MVKKSDCFKGRCQIYNHDPDRKTTNDIFPKVNVSLVKRTQVIYILCLMKLKLKESKEENLSYLKRYKCIVINPNFKTVSWFFFKHLDFVFSSFNIFFSFKPFKFNS